MGHVVEKIEIFHRLLIMHDHIVNVSSVRETHIYNNNAAFDTTRGKSEFLIGK